MVCGLGRFGLRMVELLREQGIAVTVISDGGTRADRLRRVEALGARGVPGDFRFGEVRELAGVSQARALILATSSDEANLETALDVRREAPGIRIVMRLDSDKLGARLERDFGIDAVLSPPVLAARLFSRAALEEPPAPRPAAVQPQAETAKTAARSRRGGWERWPGRFSLREPALLAMSLGLLFLSAVLVFHRLLGLPMIDAIYFTATIVTTVGFGDFNLQRESPLIKLFGVLLMFSGVTLIAVLSSYLTNFFVSGAATQVRAERAARRLRGHVILCGLGSVGFEVVEDLLERGVGVVVVDAAAPPDDGRFRQLSKRVPLLLGDATHADVLLRAGIDRARALVTMVSADAINLEIALVAQTLVEERRPTRPLRLVLRCFDPDLADRVHAVSDAYTLLSSAEIAAPIFIKSALTPNKEDKGALSQAGRV